MASQIGVGWRCHICDREFSTAEGGVCRSCNRPTCNACWGDPRAVIPSRQQQRECENCVKRGRAAQRRVTAMQLVHPSREYLAGYVDALERGWSPDNLRGDVAAREQLTRIVEDGEAFLASLVARDAGGVVTLPDGSQVPRIPGYHRWMWDGEFCGRIGLRWQPGTEALPPYCLGHIGYTVVPWKRRRGYATQALHDILPEARAEGLRYVELTTPPDNHPSQRVIEANGGVFVEEFTTPASLGGHREYRYRVRLI